MRKYNDEIKDKYYDLQEFIEDLEDLMEEYKDRVEEKYIEQIQDIWSNMVDDKNDLERIVNEIEEEEQKECEIEYLRGRI